MTDVSIVLSCYKRGKQLAKTLESIRAQAMSAEIVIVEDGCDGITEKLARQYKAKYFQKRRADLPAFQNPSRVHNIGIRNSTGKVVVLQGGEVMYNTAPDGLSKLVEPVLLNRLVATTPIVQALNAQGEVTEMLCAPEGPRAGWIINFCLAVHRSALEKIGGFEEGYTGYGFEDDQLMYSLRKIGISAKYMTDVLVSHQYHERAYYKFENESGRSQLETFIQQVEKEGRPPVANIGREWGKI
jgi:glycosyltransferase involved in cell wall biosynthesis